MHRLQVKKSQVTKENVPEDIATLRLFNTTIISLDYRDVTSFQYEILAYMKIIHTMYTNFEKNIVA